MISQMCKKPRGPDGMNPTGPTFGCCRMQLRWPLTTAHLYD